MAIFVGKISKRGSVKKLSNELPDYIKIVDGKYYNKNTGKFLETKQIGFKEFFGIK